MKKYTFYAQLCIINDALHVALRKDKICHFALVYTTEVNEGKTLNMAIKYEIIKPWKIENFVNKSWF